MLDQLNKFVFNCFQSFILGIIQGVSEFLPISSTAHLKIVPYYIGWNDPGVSISASLQLGSAFAIVFYFRKEISPIINSFSSILLNLLNINLIIIDPNIDVIKPIIILSIINFFIIIIYYIIFL